MTKTIVIINGNPQSGRFSDALADAYARGAEGAGHAVERVDVASLDFEIMRDAKAWEKSSPASLKPAQDAIARADHMVFIYPLWMGTMPALLKAFLEQVTAGGFAIEPTEDGKGFRQKLKGKSARIFVTMGMPAPLYRYWFGAHSLKSLERNILRLTGVSPVRDTLIGLIENRSDASRQRLLKRVEAMGAAAR